jgi:putative flippase GtrA
MNPFTRWLRFNLVGAIGMAVQLGTLAALHRIAPAHILIDTAIAVELTLLHNFAWHTRYTWHDRAGSSRTQQLLRFHAANGIVSLAGNIVLMRVFVQTLHVRFLVANLLAISCCALANFLASHCWAFAAKPSDTPLAFTGCPTSRF